MSTKKLKPEGVRYIVVHCSATKPDERVDAAMIDRWHRARGWLKIGYHFVIKEDGAIELGRGLDEIGAHVYGHNHHSVGVCVVGGLTAKGKLARKAEDAYTTKQITSLLLLLDLLRLKFPNAEIVGHRDLSPDTNGDGVIEPFEWLKECPCFDVRQFVQENL